MSVAHYPQPKMRARQWLDERIGDWCRLRLYTQTCFPLSLYRPHPLKLLLCKQNVDEMTNNYFNAFCEYAYQSRVPCCLTIHHMPFTFLYSCAIYLFVWLFVCMLLVLCVLCVEDGRFGAIFMWYISSLLSIGTYTNHIIFFFFIESYILIKIALKYI